MATALSAPLQQDERIADKYIVTFKDGVTANSIQAHKSQVSGFVAQGMRASGRRFNGVQKDFAIGSFQAYSGHFDQATVEEIKKSADVKHVTPVQIMRAIDLPNLNKRQGDTVTQDGAPWGLARVSSQEPGGTSYTYNSHGGEGSTVFIVDTGIDIEHPDFEGRATWGENFADKENTDGAGHGTHCAGTAVGKTFGVAKKAKVVAVKVLGSDGSGTTEGVIQGLQWAGAEGKKAGKSVISMSLGGGKDDALNDAVEAIVKDGVAVVVAAGNEGQDAANVSPASAPSAITVGATDDADKPADFSNFGALIDIWAPGVQVESSVPGGGSEKMDGTSMACPHVAGMAAYFMGEGAASGAEMAAFITGKGIDAIEKYKESTTKLLNNGLAGGNATVLNFF